MKRFIVVDSSGLVVCAPGGYIRQRDGGVVRDPLGGPGPEMSAAYAHAFRFNTHRAAARQATLVCGQVREAPA